MGRRVAIYVCSEDPLSQTGLSTQLHSQPQLELVDAAALGSDTVAVVAADELNEGTLKLLSGLNKRGCHRVVLVINKLDDNLLFSAIDAGVCAIVRRSEATATRLAQLALRAADGEAVLPSDVQSRLLRQVSRLQHHVLVPLGLSHSGLSEREVRVLRLVADGLDTHQIARELCYSERTVKVILHDVINRFQLRNRSHAVAYALREGLI
jgi:DNA-binding NarL/FixJ family response regulator